MSDISIEHLLKPRYKVIHKWPSMRDFHVGQIVLLDKKFSPQYMMYEIEDCQGKRSYITKFFDDYPKLFRKLEWFEERSVDEMPKYVKFKPAYKNKERIVKAEWKNDGDGEIYFTHKNDPRPDLGYNIQEVEPATEQQFLDYINKKP